MHFIDKLESAFGRQKNPLVAPPPPTPHPHPKAYMNLNMIIKHVLGHLSIKVCTQTDGLQVGGNQVDSSPPSQAHLAIWECNLLV
jgi:hypothetical protein